MHDLGHIRQIAELVRARKHLAGAGELGKSYQFEAMIITKGPTPIPRTR
jgi:hypothetical protein